MDKYSIEDYTVILYIFDSILFCTQEYYILHKSDKSDNSNTFFFVAGLSVSTSKDIFHFITR